MIKKTAVKNKSNKSFNYLDIEEIDGRIELEVFDTIHYYDLRDYFAILSTGKLLLIYESESGKRLPIKTFFRKGMLLGGHSYLSEECSAENYYFIATEKVEILKISPKKSKELLNNADFLLQLLKDTTKDSFMITQELLYRLSKDIEKFLAYILLNQSEDGKIKIKNFSLFSEFLKCSRSNFYVALGKLIDRGLIIKSNRIITIVDLDKLKKFTEL